MAATPMNPPTTLFGLNQERIKSMSDMIMAVLLITIIAMLIVPLPSWLLDTLLIINIATSVTVLMVSLYNNDPLEMSVFPSLLLVMTLYRLSLNVAATKLILGQGHAGAIIEAFGQFVIGGSYIVGIIAFLILIVVQFVVITNGAGRVAEVAARFTLDAMPGKQMAIDADLNAGLITEDQAKKRRRSIEREADFFGSMDGASKFVRGDAVAAILITIINIIGGFALGMARGEDFTVALQKYTLLTIGEGLVSQIPALLISTSTGIIVTRGASDSPLGQEFAAQILMRPRPLAIVSGVLLVIALLPGFPKLQLVLIAAAVGAASYLLTKREQNQATEVLRSAQVQEAIASAPTSDSTPEQVMGLLNIERIEVELGSNLVPLAVPEEGGDLVEKVGNVRKAIALELGVILPTVRIRDNLQLRVNTYQIKIKGAVVASHNLMTNSVLALDSGLAFQRLDGIETIEPAHGTPAIWIDRAMKERAEIAGYITIDPASVLVAHLTEVIRSHSAEMLTRQETQKLIENVKQSNEAVVSELIPAQLSLGEVQKILQNLLHERVGIRDLNTILETLADYAPRTKDVDQLSEFARAALSRQICKQYQEEDGVLRVITLAPSVEQQLREGVQQTANGNMLAIEPQFAQALLRSINQQIESGVQQGYNPVLLCSGQIRLPLKRLIERSQPTLPIMAYTEIVPKVEVEAVGNVEVELSLV